jgi:hypothetical protein
MECTLPVFLNSKNVMSKVYFFVLILLIPFMSDAQPDTSSDTTRNWKTGGVISLNISQVALSNWVAGGQNSMAANSLFNYFFNYKRDNKAWDNTIDLGYGIIKQNHIQWIKSDDHIDISSKYGQYAFKEWYYSALINFKTQFSAGYNYPNDSVKISDFLAPGYGLLALGLDYKPNDNFTMLIAPVTAKFTIVKERALADAGAFGVDPAEFDDAGNLARKGDNLRKEIGGYVKIAFKQKLMQNVTFQTKADFFSNYLNNPGNIDISAEFLLSLKVNKFISATVLTNLIYDDDIKIPVDTDKDGQPDAAGPRTQLKEVLAVGFSYKF